MAAPSFVTLQDPFFTGHTKNAVVLETISGYKYMILWDSLTAVDQAQITAFVTSVGGSIPGSGGLAAFKNYTLANGSKAGVTYAGLIRRVGVKPAGTSHDAIGFNKEVFYVDAAGKIEFVAPADGVAGPY